MKKNNVWNSSLIFVLTCWVLMDVCGLDIHKPDIVPRYSGAQPNEWTMDYDAAFDYAATNGLNTIVMFSGAWWCGDCQNVEDTVLSSAEWQQYINVNPAMLVMLDFNIRPIYNLPKDHPYNKCFLWDPEYLASNDLIEAEGEERLAFNYNLQEYYCVPSKLAENGYYKVNYPTLVFHNSEGERCGRVQLEQLDGVSVEKTIRCYEQAIQGDLADEMDDEALMEPFPLCFSGTELPEVSASLSEVDLADNYSFFAYAGYEYCFSFGENSALPAEPLTVSVLDESGTNTLSSYSVNPAVGAELIIPAFSDGKRFLKVALQAPQTNLVGYSFECRQYFSETNSFEAEMGIWVQTTGDDFDWTRNSGYTPSSGTGPDAASD